MRPSDSQKTVVGLDEAEASPVALLGPKARNLARLKHGGVSVPDAFVVTVLAWRRFVEAARLGEAVARELGGLVKGSDLGELREAARKVGALVADAPLPAELSAEIREAYRRLGGGPVAVRSSAPEEDQLERSAAGVFRTVLDVRGEDAVLDAIKECWSSLCSEAALAYRLDRGLPPAGLGMAVVVQEMLAPDTAGVLFTRSPLGDGKKPDRDVILVEAVPGRGAPLVDGEANPERYEISDEGPVPQASSVPQTLLSRDSLSALSRAAHRVEELLGPAVDVEWAICDGRLRILQARPITTLATRTALGEGRRHVPVRWTAANTQEALQDPVAPLTWSLLLPLIEKGRRDLFSAAGFQEIDGPGYVRLFHGRPYFNPEYFRQWLRQIPGAPENVFDALIFGEGKVEVHFRLPEFDRRTFRKIGLLVAARLAARERFLLFLKIFEHRVGRLLARDLAAASDEALLDVRSAAVGLAESALHRHVLGTAIAGATYLLLDLLLKETGVEKTLGEGLTARLTAGARGNVLGLANERLHHLAQLALSDATLRGALSDGPPRTALSAIADLARGGSGTARASAKAFLDLWRRFLDDHGHRAEQEAELAAPRWVEDPSAVVSILRSYVGAPDREPPRERESRLAGSARALALRVVSALRRAGGLERVLPWRAALFWLLYRDARRYAPYRENLKAAALRALLVVKRVFLEMGRRLAARGTLERPEDVFFLEVAEVDAAFAGRADPRVVRALVRERRQAHDVALATPPPPFVLESPDGSVRAISSQDASASSANVLRGVQVSQGQATGTARVLRSLDEATRVRPGDVIVARIVNAAWTPLFVLAGGIVAEVGGALSHGAIVAREYGIPCVFGVAGATTRIHDGDTVHVDANRGTVEVLGAPTLTPPA